MTYHLHQLMLDRRNFFSRCGLSLGSVALSSLLAGQRSLSAATGERQNPLAPRPTHFPAKAKNVIYLFMVGGPSHLDLLEYKPKLNQLTGEPIPESYLQGQKFAQIKEKQPKIMGSPWKFARHGESGTYVSELLPHTATIVDDLTILKTVKTEEIVHPFAELLINTGSRDYGKPSMGAWVTYGLGSESQDLPGFVVLQTGGYPRAKGANYGNGFLPSSYQGVPLRNSGEPMMNLQRPMGVSTRHQQELVETVTALNAIRFEQMGDPEISARISAYELASRMQVSAPNLLDLKDESKHTLDLYGADLEKPSFGRSCLLARRMVERGVRFVQVFHGDWDHHGSLADRLPVLSRQIDQGCAALVKDLKQRGLLGETLVIWGGEFGRTPVAQQQETSAVGRDHHIEAFTVWMAGGGVKPGVTIGATDELGYYAIEDSVHIHDLQATILHLLGLEHTKLTYRFKGRDFRLTDVGGNVVTKLLG
jgi:Protein of unknown function (DUF1501)